jgi:hypothetical protein
MLRPPGIPSHAAQAGDAGEIFCESGPIDSHSSSQDRSFLRAYRPLSPGASKCCDPPAFTDSRCAGGCRR